MKKLLLLMMLIIPLVSFSQALKLGTDLTVVHFNAGWNSANDVKWVTELDNAKLKNCDIATDTEAASKYEIVVVPTIVIFKDGEEVKRFQADISFTMKATLEEVQEAVDDANMDDF
jgi:hypothetical protein